jgi:uncharacterized glyoxalase superfamily protein PhnB
MAYKPEGYNDLSPYLSAHNARALLQFLKDAFGAETLRMYEDDEGKIMHGEARIGDSVIMFSQASEGWPATKAVLHLYVPDANAAYAKALAAGAKEVQPPSEREGDPDRRGTFTDPFGNGWSVSHEVGS